MADYDLILVGSSFASSFFLHEYLRHAKPTAKILVLERGRRRSYPELVKMRFDIRKLGDQTFVRKGRKPWWYAPTFGGTSNMWYGNTPRFLPEDFELNRRFGVGMDWPIGYDDLEPNALRQLKAGYKDTYRFRDKIDIEGLDHPKRMFDLTEGLIRRKYSDQEIRGILGGNFIRVLSEIWPARTTPSVAR